MPSWRRLLPRRAAQPRGDHSVVITAGGYTLCVRFDRDVAGQLHDDRFSVPKTDESNDDQPLDLRTLMLG